VQARGGIDVTGEVEGFASLPAYHIADILPASGSTSPTMPQARPSSAPCARTPATPASKLRAPSGRDLIQQGEYLGVKPVDRSGYAGFGTEAVKLFLEWTRQLAGSGFLDVLSIGTSAASASSSGRAPLAVAWGPGQAGRPACRPQHPVQWPEGDGVLLEGGLGPPSLV